MAKLTEEELATLAELEKRRDEPDEKPEKTGLGRMLNVTVDLSDEASVERAFSLGLLERPVVATDDDEDGDDEDGDEGGKKKAPPKKKTDDEDGDGPKRRGFFNE